MFTVKKSVEDCKNEYNNLGEFPKSGSGEPSTSSFLITEECLKTAVKTALADHSAEENRKHYYFWPTRTE